MRLESDRYRHSAEAGRVVDDLPEQALVGQVHAIEAADRDDRGSQRPRGQAAVNLQPG